MTEKVKKWADENVAKLLEIVGDASPVTGTAVEAAAKALEVSARSVAAKLRQLDREVESMAQVKVAAFTAEEGAALAEFVNSNVGVYTYKEIAEQFAEGKFNNKQIQGKILALELTGAVKAADKVEVAKTYSDIEEVAHALSKTLPSVRGKALSLLRAGSIAAIPKQKESHAKESGDPVEALGTDIAGMTVADIAKAVDKTERGVRTLLTRRGIAVKDYDGAGKKAKAEGKAAKATA